MTLEEIEKKIASVCRDEPAILAAYLFGSFARGRAGKSSDLDVALLLDKGAEARFSLLAFMVAVEKKSGSMRMSSFSITPVRKNEQVGRRQLDHVF